MFVAPKLATLYYVHHLVVNFSICFLEQSNLQDLSDLLNWKIRVKGSLNLLPS